MKQTGKNAKEIVGVLSLSLILVSTFSVSACLPEMFRYYSEYSRASVEMLISLPSMMMVFMIAVSPVILKRVRERLIICTGLILIGIAGVIPFFVTQFSMVMLSRVLLGIGIGLVNTRAVSLIGERFEGQQKARLMGVRVSMESLGQAGMTFVAGILLATQWNRAFLVYLFAFVILGVYLLCVSEEESPKSGTRADGDQTVKEAHGKLKASEWRSIVCFVLLNAIAVSASTVISLRVPNLIVEMKLGSASVGATVLTLSVVAGFVGGIVFGKLMSVLKKYALPVFLMMVAAGFLLISFGKNLVFITAGALVGGFFIPVTLSYGFHFLSECTPKGALDTANAAVLVGCNLGASFTPVLLGGIDRIYDSNVTCFLFYAALLFVLVVVNKVTHVFEG